MLHSYEAEVGTDGTIRLREPLTLQGRYRAVVTVLEPLETDPADTEAPDALHDWRRFTGILKGSLNFNGDPVAVQKALRDEWD